MGATLLTKRKLFGLFELDLAGTVLYSRFEPDGEPGPIGPDISGRNFYEEVTPFSNIEEFRQRVAHFTRGVSAADNFTFSCQYEGSTQPVKVLLARVHERSSSTLTKSVLMHIRKDA